MKVLLLAAGFGTRLKPLTDTCPKCLLKIKGIPILGIWLDYLHKIGLNSIFINTHYLAAKVEKYINNSAFNESVELLYEYQIQGTAGTIIYNINKFIDDDLLLIHADNYSEADLIKLQEAHNSRPKYCTMTMLLFQTSNPQKCGIVKRDEQGVVVEFYEKVDTPPSNLANAAIYILSVEMLNELKDKNYKDFSCEVIPKYLGRIYTYETEDRLIDIGTIDDYKKVNSN